MSDKRDRFNHRSAQNGTGVSQETTGLEYHDLEALLSEDAGTQQRSAAHPRHSADTEGSAHRQVPVQKKSAASQKSSRQVSSSRSASTSHGTEWKATAGADSPRRGSSSAAAGKKRRNDDDAEPLQERFRDPSFWVHIILPAAIVVIGLSAFLLYRNWAKGEKVVIDEGNESRYSIEVNDSMVLLPESKLEGHEDDGETTILCLGDAPFSDETGENGLAGQISALSGATTINAAFPDSQVACYNRSYKTDTQHDMDDIFNLFYVAYAISIGDFSSMENVAALHTDNDQFQTAVKNLENTDFSKVDIIAIMYDASDYVNSSPLTDPTLDLNEQLNTYQGAMSNAFQAIQEKYPYIRIVFMSPTYMLREDENGKLQDARTDNFGNGTIIQYWQYAYDTCGDNGVSFLDNYYGSINERNYTEYLSDNIHLNDAGRTKVADHFVYKVINNEYGEYDADSLAVAK